VTLNFSPTQLADITSRYQAGASLAAVAGIYGVTAPTIRRELTTLGVTIRQRVTGIDLRKKTPKGRDDATRDTRPKPKVRHVEDEECEGVQVGTHELVKRAERGRVVVACRWCGEPWVVLDAELRGGS